MKLLSGIFLILSVIFAEVASGELFSYTDSNGVVHFVDDIGKVPKRYQKQMKDSEPLGTVNVMHAPSRPSSVRTAQENSPKKPKPSVSSPKVEVFMTSWCGYCRQMIHFLNEKGIPYTAYDIENDKAAAQTYSEMGVRGVPVVRVGSHIVLGYDPDSVLTYYNGGH